MYRQTCFFNKEGYSLVELMISVAIAMLALGILSRAFISQRVAYEEQTQVVEMQQQAKIAMHLMTSELQMAGYLPEASGNRPTGDDIQSVGTTDTLTFIGHIDSDDPPKTEKVEYTVNGDNELTREVWETWNGSSWTGSMGAQALADNVVSLAIEYDSGTPSLVRKIKITLTVANKKTFSTLNTTTDDRSQTLSTEITPRNLGL